MTKKIVSKTMMVFRLTKEFILLIAFLILFFIVMRLWGHQQQQPQLWAGFLVLFSTIKIYLLVSHTFKKLDRLIEDAHSFNHMLLLLGAIISIIIISFALDYFCISEIYPTAFTGIQDSQSLLFRFSDLLYFSVVTFTTVGYGDIFPSMPVAKLITVLEMMSAFIVIVFVISKYFKNN
jgi:voltage-gated potassium channel Kch